MRRTKRDDKNTNSIAELMEKLKALNTRRNESKGLFNGLFPQVQTKPEPLGKGIPSLVRNVYLNPSPMIEARFSVVGRWENGVLCQTWLAISEMKKAWTDKSLLGQISLRRENWPQSPLRTHPPERTSLFAVDKEEGEESYLLWPPMDGAEPAVLRYVGHDEQICKDLAAFIKRQLR
jgi:hypothetical protein